MLRRVWTVPDLVLPPSRMVSIAAGSLEVRAAASGRSIQQRLCTTSGKDSREKEREREEHNRAQSWSRLLTLYSKTYPGARNREGGRAAATAAAAAASHTRDGNEMVPLPTVSSRAGPRALIPTPYLQVGVGGTVWRLCDFF